jgi:GT2 family glycosyltransferase
LNLKNPRISVIVLAFNGGELLLRCVDSVIRTNYDNFEVILVDNASTDGSIETVEKNYGLNKKLKIIRNTKNLGFSKGNNIGAKHSTGEYLAFLNQDTIVDSAWLTEAMKTFNLKSSIGAVQCKLLKLDNPKLIDSAGVLINILGIAIQLGYNDKDSKRYNEPYPVTSGLAAALIIKKEIFMEIGGFDEDFFMLSEDGDLCWRVWLRGYEVWFSPHSIVYHKGGTARSRYSSEKNYYYSFRNRFIMLTKNLGLSLLIVSIPLTVLYLFIRGLRYGDFHYFKALISAIKWNLRNLRLVLIKRKSVQELRKVSDKYLLKNRILGSLNLEFIIKGF